jgi:DNA-directed RNA polymerase specialized sigma24 family protein
MTRKRLPDASLDVLREMGWEPSRSIETTASTTETALWHLIESTVTPRMADVLLAAFDSTSLAAAAELLGVTPSTVRVTKHLIRKRLEGVVGRSPDGRINVSGCSGTSK